MGRKTLLFTIPFFGKKITNAKRYLLWLFCFWPVLSFAVNSDHSFELPQNPPQNADQATIIYMNEGAVIVGMENVHNVIVVHTDLERSEKKSPKKKISTHLISTENIKIEHEIARKQISEKYRSAKLIFNFKISLGDSDLSAFNSKTPTFSVLSNNSKNKENIITKTYKNITFLNFRKEKQEFYYTATWSNSTKVGTYSLRGPPSILKS